MSNLDAVIKVTDQLISRVFNHRQFTTGEINYLTRELNGGLKNTLENNFDKLLKINENVCLAADTNNPQSYAAYEAKAREISEQVGLLVARAERLITFGGEGNKSTGPSKDQDATEATVDDSNKSTVDAE